MTGHRFHADEAEINACHDLAVATLHRNIQPYRAGPLTEERPAIMAGGDYPTPWTRDAAYNVWNAGALLVPDAARDTLRSVLVHDTAGLRIGGQYWDAIAWAIGAWHLYCLTGDREFLGQAFEATANSLDFFERTELDPATGLFAGPASYGDGVSAYPEPYSDAGGSSCVLDYPAAHPEMGKIHIKALSTNCLYYGAYHRAAWMERELERDARAAEWERKAEHLRDAINGRLWMGHEGRYGYFLDNDNELVPHMEGLGQSLAVLLGVADDERANRLLSAQHTTPFGIPCVWPVFPRFVSADGMTFGRHNGTVWPFIQAFWADAAARHGRVDLLDRELQAFTRATTMAGEFYEIIHPVTGKPYGGLQVDNAEMRLWGSCRNQTWSATGYLRILYRALLGMAFDPSGIRFRPRVPDRFSEIVLQGIRYRNATIDLRIRGHGRRIASFRLDGQASEEHRFAADLADEHIIDITME